MTRSKTRVTCFTSTEVLAYLYASTSAQFTCFASTKVHLLVPSTYTDAKYDALENTAELLRREVGVQVLSLLAELVKKCKY